MEDQLKGEDGGVYTKTGGSSHYNKAFIDYMKLEEMTGGSIFAFLACQTQVNKYMKRIGLKAGVPAEKDFVKMAFYREAGNFYKERVDYVNKCIESQEVIDNTKGYPASLDLIDLIAPQVLAWNHSKTPLAYNLTEIIEKRLNKDEEK